MSPRWKRSLVLAVALVALAAIPQRVAALVVIRTLVLYPGFLPAAIFWPQGAHTGAGTGPIGTWVMFAVIYAGSAAFWAVVFYALHGLFGRKARVV